jgi:dTDP-4-dehydrorhamnose reductase
VIWLIGNRGMLGTDVERLLKKRKLSYVGSDLELDIMDLYTLQSYTVGKAIDWIINCAAYTNVDKAEVEQDKAFKINAEGVLNISQVALEIDARLIHISTDYVFDGKKKEAYTESDQPNPQNVYGRSKLKGERNIEQTMSNYYILRTAWLYGTHGHNFVHTMLRLFNERDRVQVVSDQWGSPTYTMDLAQAILTIINKDSSEYGVYHVTNEGRTNWYEFAKAIYAGAVACGLIDREVEILPISSKNYPTKAVRPQNSYMSKNKFKSTYGSSLSTWQEGLKSFLNEIVHIQGAVQ